MQTVKADMCNLSFAKNEEFDIIFCPVSITYIPDPLPMFKECYRVLKPNGIFLLGTSNPHIYAFDGKKWDEGVFIVTNKLPFNSFDELSDKETEQFIKEKNAVEYSHTMQTLIGNQLDVGFVITGFYEDNDDDEICKYFSKYFMIRSVKM